MAPRLFHKIQVLSFQKMYGGTCHPKWYQQPPWLMDYLSTVEFRPGWVITVSSLMLFVIHTQKWMKLSIVYLIFVVRNPCPSLTIAMENAWSGHIWYHILQISFKCNDTISRLSQCCKMRSYTKWNKTNSQKITLFHLFFFALFCYHRHHHFHNPWSCICFTAANWYYQGVIINYTNLYGIISIKTSHSFKVTKLLAKYHHILMQKNNSNRKGLNYHAVF